MSYTPLILQVSGLARAPLDPDCTCLDRCDCSFLAHVHNTNVRLAHSYRRCECEQLRCEHYYQEYLYCEQDIERADKIYAVVNPSQDTLRAALVEQNELYLSQAEERYQAARRVEADLMEMAEEEERTIRDGLDGEFKRGTRTSSSVSRASWIGSPAEHSMMSVSPSGSSSTFFSPMMASPRTPVDITLEEGFFPIIIAPKPAPRPVAHSRSQTYDAGGRGSDGSPLSDTPKPSARSSSIRTVAPHPALMLGPTSTSNPIPSNSQTRPRSYLLPLYHNTPGSQYQSNPQQTHTDQTRTHPSTTSNLTYLPGPATSVPMVRTRASRGHKRRTRQTASGLPAAAIYAEIEARPFVFAEGCPPLMR